MSGRQSLYGQSLVRKANALNFGHDASQEKHWKRDWYSPSKSVPASSTSITPSATPTPFGDERETPSLESQQQNHKFRVKVWTIDNDYRPIVDGDEEDILDIEEYSIIKKKDADGLSDAAIRGAVGAGGEAIPGISNDNGSKPEEKDEEKKNESTEEPKPEQSQDTTKDVPKDTEVNDAAQEPETQSAPVTAEAKPETTENPTESTQPEPKDESATYETNETSEQSKEQSKEPEVTQTQSATPDQTQEADAEGDVVVE